MVVHGGPTDEIWKLIQQNKLENVIREFCENKIYIGISAGSQKLSKRATWIRDDDEFFETDLDTRLIGVSNLRYDVHFNDLKGNKFYIENLKKASKLLKEPIYLLLDGSYIINSSIFVGPCYKIENGLILRVQ